MIAPRPVTPSDCQHCNIPLPHGRQFTEAAGLHGWTPPTNAQILARMIARRNARTRSKEPAMEDNVRQMADADRQQAERPRYVVNQLGFGYFAVRDTSTELDVSVSSTRKRADADAAALNATA